MDDNPEDEVEEKIEEQNQQENPEENSQRNWDDYVDFTVVVNNSSGKYFVAECSCVEGDIQIGFCNVVSDPIAYKALNPFNNTHNSFKGPDFNTLDDRLQEALLDYLRSLTIDEELGTFIEHVSLDKEQDLYVKWLKDVKSFL